LRIESKNYSEINLLASLRDIEFIDQSDGGAGLRLRANARSNRK
jgi:hypothetical protein